MTLWHPFLTLHSQHTAWLEIQLVAVQHHFSKFPALAASTIAQSFLMVKHHPPDLVDCLKAPSVLILRKSSGEGAKPGLQPAKNFSCRLMLFLYSNKCSCSEYMISSAVMILSPWLALFLSDHHNHKRMKIFRYISSSFSKMSYIFKMAFGQFISYIRHSSSKPVLQTALTNLHFRKQWPLSSSNRWHIEHHVPTSIFLYFVVSFLMIGYFWSVAVESKRLYWARVTFIVSYKMWSDAEHYDLMTKLHPVESSWLVFLVLLDMQILLRSFPFVEMPGWCVFNALLDRDL